MARRSKALIYQACRVAWLYPYWRNVTLALLEQLLVPASQTLYVYLARPVSPVESVYEPSFAVVTINAPFR